MEKEKEIRPLILAKRPTIQYNTQHRDITLYSNHFQIEITNVNKIFIFNLDFQPRIDYDNSSLKE